jgi:hypothetical protein
MKISFPKYGPSELLPRKPGATCTILFVAIAFFAGVCGSYLLGNKLWLLTIAVLGLAGILVCLGVAVVIFLNQSEVNEAPSAPIEEKNPRIISQWDYRPTKPIRASAVFDSPDTETSEALSPDSFSVDKIDDNVWRADDSHERDSHSFVNDPAGLRNP